MEWFEGSDRFQVQGLLGVGGMGAVYRAWDRERERHVALKTLLMADPESVLRIKREFRSLTDLNHPNLVTLGELIESGGRWFFTMELVDGVDFLAYVRPGARAEAAVTAGAPLIPAPGASRGAAAVTVRDPTPALAPAVPASRPPLDYGRLLAALPQLADALATLHAAGHTHGDIKPPNILVTPQGRVVVLDFGLARFEAGADEELGQAGTPGYISPEVLAGGAPGPAADLYAVGVVLRDAISEHGAVDTGAPHPSGAEPDAGFLAEVAPECPEAIVALCAALLDADPARRPAAAEIRRQLVGVSESAAVAAGAPGNPVFVGRLAEQSQLAEALSASRSRAVPILIRGDSGMGKTALVAKFLDSLPPFAAGGPLVLKARCYERDSVPYKAFDEVVDALARHLRRLPAVDVAALLPLDTPLLAHTFPVLTRVGAVAALPASGEPVGDPLELRARVSRAVRSIFARLAERGPLIVAIDDLQWADADSIVMLREMLRPPDEPRFLIVATVRPGEEATRILAVAAAGGVEVRLLPLERLHPAEAETLAARLLAQESPVVPVTEARALAEEAGGHPLFIAELVRHVAAQGGLGTGALSLEAVLEARVARLPARARRVLEVVAVAQTPVAQSVAARAVDVEYGDFSHAVADLRAARLVRTTGVRRAHLIETYHDRVRAAVLHSVGEPVRREHHRQLALALEATGDADPAALTLHWWGANEPARAGYYAVVAAGRSEEALAFDQAAALYRLSLSVLPRQGAERVALLTRLGEALVNAGRGEEAATEFLAAAEAARLLGPGDDALRRASSLESRAGEQLLHSGFVDSGLATLERMLQPFGLSLAPTPARAFASLLFHRARLRLRGLRYRERPATEIPPEELRRIDVCWSIATGFSIIDSVRGADFQTRHLLLALRAGEPVRLARALSMEASYSAAGGPGSARRSARLVAAARGVADRTGSPHAAAMVASAEGFTAYFEGRWRTAHEALARSARIFRDECTGANWERDSVELGILWTHYYLGTVAELHRRVPGHLQEAQARGDVYSATNLSIGFANLAWLVAGDADGARRVATAAMERWSYRGFHVQHSDALIALAHAALYRGDPEDARTLIAATWPHLARSFLLWVHVTRVESYHLRARATLAAARIAPPGRRGALARAAAQDGRRLAREGAAWSTALGLLLDAGVADLRGDVDRAAARLREAAAALAAADMALYAAAARCRLGQLLGGDVGASLRADAEAWMTGQGIREPGRFVALLAPGFRDP